jgi:hypothetical protein
MQIRGRLLFRLVIAVRRLRAHGQLQQPRAKLGEQSFQGFLT